MATRVYVVPAPGEANAFKAVTFRTNQAVKQISGVQYEGIITSLGLRFITVDIGGRNLSFRPNDLKDNTSVSSPPSPE